MTEDPDRLNWSGTDDSGDSDHFAAYLDMATAMGEIQAYKTRSYERLDLQLGDRVLEAGCGIGDDALALGELVGPSGTVIGVDNSAALIELARGSAVDVPGVTFQVGDIYDLAFGRDRFDVGRADRVFQHLDRPGDALAELKRVTRPGGRVSVIDPDWASLALDAPGEAPPHDFLDPSYATVANPGMGRKLFRLFRNAGFLDPAVEPFVLTNTDVASTLDMGEVGTWIGRMREDDRFSEEMVGDWRARLERADEEGTFFAALPAYHVTAIVPS